MRLVDHWQLANPKELRKQHPLLSEYLNTLSKSQKRPDIVKVGCWFWNIYGKPSGAVDYWSARYSILMAAHSMERLFELNCCYEIRRHAILFSLTRNDYLEGMVAPWHAHFGVTNASATTN